MYCVISPEEDRERDEDEGTDKGCFQSLFWTPGVYAVFLTRGNDDAVGKTSCQWRSDQRVKASVKERDR